MSIAAFWSNNSYLIVSMCIAFLLALSMHLTFVSGLLFLGQPAAMAFGAYTGGYISMHASMPWAVVLIISMVVGALVSGAMALLVRKMPPLQCGMVSLALVAVVQSVAISAHGLTGGALGMIGVPARTSSVQILIIAACVCLFFVWFARSQWDLEIRCLRQSLIAAQGGGWPLTSIMVRVFALSGLLAGLAGCLQVHYYQYTSPDGYGFELVLTITVAVIVGGKLRWWGCLIGAVAVEAFPHIASGFSQWVPTAYGAVLIVVVLLFPLGAAGGLEKCARAIIARLTTLGRSANGSGARVDPPDALVSAEAGEVQDGWGR